MGDADQYVSRGGLKLAAALDASGLDVSGFVCADLGCNVGGFTDVLLQRGAAQVYAVDTGYGALAWKLRQDERVVVMERSNAMHVEPPVVGVDLVVIDLGWTPQRHAIPAALRWGPRWIVTLIKPHYESTSGGARGGGGRGRAAVLDDAEAERVVSETLDGMAALGVRVAGSMRSPIRGGKSKGKAGNAEWLAWLEPAEGVSGGSVA
ncbi:MAG: TlyA family RNA methyltransferase [Phycisphaera sp.]|nr:TlyA family RNA methyltransferase [Phycisphaera sp.]